MAQVQLQLCQQWEQVWVVVLQLVPWQLQGGVAILLTCLKLAARTIHLQQLLWRLLQAL